MPTETSEPAAPDANPKRKRILLIEDEPIARLQLLQKLRESGFDVDVASSGQVALERIRSTGPDAIFMDLLLPDVKGVDVIKAARQDPKFRNRPIYVCTSAAMIDVWARRATKAGATKVFNRAVTPMDEIAAQVSADLAGDVSPADAGGRKAGSRGADVSKRVPPVQAEGGTKREAANPEAAPRSAPLLRRVFSSFKFNKVPAAPRPAGLPATPPTPVQPPPVAGVSNISPSANLREHQAPASAPASAAETYQLAPDGTVDPIGFGALITLQSDQPAVVSFNEAGIIVSANEACAVMFGWEGASLVGEGLAALLRPGTDQDVRRFIHERLQGGSLEGKQSLNVVARRRDGVEFPASVTTLIWSSETKLILRSDASVSCLTAIFRPLPAGQNVSSGPAPATIPAAPSGLPPAPGVPQEAYDEVQRQFSAISSEAEALRESLACRERETADVVGRLTTHEEELKRTQATLEAERSERKTIEERSRELAARLAVLEQRSTEQDSADEDPAGDAGHLAKELGEARAALATVDEAFNQNVAHCGRLETERLEMRQEIEALNARLAALQQQAEEPSRRTEELEERLRSVLDNLDRMRSDPENRSDVERNLETELTATKAAADHAEACLREEVERSKSFERRLNVLSANLRQEQSERGKRFEEEFARHRDEREALNGQLAAEQEKASEARRHAEELEGNLAGNLADLQRVKAELDHQIEDQRRSEAEWREKLDSADAQARKLAEALQQAEQRAKALQQDLSALHQDRAELTERLGAEQQAAAEIKFRVDDLEERLRQNAAELEQVKSDRATSQQSSEMAMANLYHMRDLLGSKLEIEQRVAAESDKRSQAVEEQLRKNSVELEQVKEELIKQSDEQVALERKLQQQMEEARFAAGQAEASLKAKQDECSRLQAGLSDLQHAGDDLRHRLTAVQQAADKAQQTSGEFEQQLQERTAELERVKAEQIRQAEEQKKIETELQSQLLAAQSATEHAAAACEEEAQRNRAFEERLREFGNSLKQEQLGRTRRMEAELDALRQTCGKLTENHAAEQAAAAAARKQCEALEQQLRARTAEAEGLSREQSRQSQELNRLTSALQGARTELEQSAGKLGEQTQENGRQKAELEQRLRVKSEEARRLVAGQAKRAQEQTRLESELQAAKAALEKSEAASRENAGSFGRLQTELQQTQTDLGEKLAASNRETAAARQQNEQLHQQVRKSSEDLERLNANQEKQQKEKARLESELQASKALAAKTDSAVSEKTKRVGQLEQEMANLRKELQESKAQVVTQTDLGEKLAASKRETAAARQQNEQLHQQARKSSEDLERLKANQEKQQKEKAHLETELQASKTLAAKTEPALSEKAKQVSQLEQEMANLRKELQESKAQFATQQQSVTKLKRQGKELEKQKQTHEGELAKLRAMVEEHAQARKNLELERQKKTVAANEAAGRLRSDLETSASERARLQGEVGARLADLEALKAELTAARNEAAEAQKQRETLEARLGQAGEEIKRAQESRASERVESENQRLTESTATLTAEMCLLREGRGSMEAQLMESQRQIQEGVNRLTRATADFEKERGERRRAENRVDSLTEQLQELHGQIKVHLDSELANQSRMTNLEQNLRQNEDQLARVNDDLQKERTDRQLVGQQLRAADALSSQLRNCLTSFDLAKEGFKRAQTQLEARLQANQDALNESQAKLQHEIAERLRKEESIAQAQRVVQEQSQSISTELARLNAELEEERAERKRMEGGFAQSRYASLESARSGLAMVSRLRSQIREPVEGLMQLTRRLLEAELETEPKQLVESLLENALLVQRTLQEAGTLNACSGRENEGADGGNGSRSGDPAAHQPGSERQP